MHQKRIQFRTFLICEVLSPGGDLRLDWRAGNMAGKMLKSLSSVSRIRTKLAHSQLGQCLVTSPDPLGLCPLLELEHMDMVCKVCFIHADSNMEKGEELGLDFQRSSVLNYVDNCIRNLHEQLL